MKQNTVNIILITLVVFFVVILGGLVLMMRGRTAETNNQSTQSEDQPIRRNNRGTIPGNQQKQEVIYDEVVNIGSDFTSVEKKVAQETKLGIRNTSGKKLFLIEDNNAPIAIEDQETFFMPAGNAGVTLYRIQGLEKEAFISIIR